jgi:hypothetical protein
LWIVDGAGLAARRRVEVAGAGFTAADSDPAAWVIAQSGLNASDKLIDQGREGLSEGTRLRITRED